MALLLNGKASQLKTSETLLHLLRQNKQTWHIMTQCPDVTSWWYFSLSHAYLNLNMVDTTIRILYDKWYRRLMVILNPWTTCKNEVIIDSPWHIMTDIWFSPSFSLVKYILLYFILAFFIFRYCIHSQVSAPMPRHQDLKAQAKQNSRPRAPAKLERGTVLRTSTQWGVKINW